jgi:L-threonylcarbamoyladenylate synthase
MMIRENDWEKAIAAAKQQALKVGVMAGPTIVNQVQQNVTTVFTYADDSVEAATKGLFAGLRALDETNPKLDVIYVATFPEKDLGVAYMNRLKKAAAQQYFE